MLKRYGTSPDLPERKHGERQSGKQLDRLVASVLPQHSSSKRRSRRCHMFSRALFCHLEKVRSAPGAIQLESKAARCLLLSTSARICRVHVFPLSCHSTSVLFTCCQAHYREHLRVYSCQVRFLFILKTQ